MAKLKKRILRWQASSSPQVIGYKLYWSESGDLNYDSNQVILGNVTEIVLPDDVDSFKPNGGPVGVGHDGDSLTFIEGHGDDGLVAAMVASFSGAY